MKKKWLCLLFALFTFSAYASELKNFDELKSAIQRGESINVVTFVNECQSDKDRPHTVTMAGTLVPTSFMIINDKIVTSDLHFTRNNPKYKDKSIFEFITYTFRNDQHMVLRSQSLEAGNYSPLDKERELICAIGSSVKLFST